MPEQSGKPLQTLLREGLGLLKQRDLTGAQNRFEEAVASYGDDPTARLLYGVALTRQQGEIPKGIEHLEQAATLAQESPTVIKKVVDALVRAKRPYRALRVLEKSLATGKMPAELFERFYNIGLSSGWYWEGFRAIRKAIEMDPAAGRRREGLARLYLNLRDFEAALDVLSPVLEQEKGIRSDAHYLHAEILRELERRSEAVEAVNRGLENDQRTPKTLMRAAQYQVQLGGLADALSYAKEALELDPIHAPALLMLADFSLWNGNCAEAADYATTLESIPGQEKNASRIHATCCVLQEEWDTALERLDALIEEDTQDSVALILRGEAKRAKGDYDSAVTDIDMGIIHAHGYTLQANISRLMTITEQQDQMCGRIAKDAFEELLRLSKPILPNPEEDVLCNGAPQEVRRLITHTFRCFKGNRSPNTTYIRHDDPSETLTRLHIQAHSRFSSRYAQELIRTRSVEDVLEFFDEMIAADPDNPIIYTHSGEVLLWLGRYEESLVEFKKSIAITPKVRWAYIGLCANELMLGNYQKALDWCSDGLKAFPPPGRTMFPYRAEVYRRMGKLDLARKDMKRAAEMTPGRMTGWMNEALIERAFGDESLMVPAYRKVVERNPCIVETALDEMDNPFDLQSPTIDGIEELFEYMMLMMRGNRSSDFVTYFTRDGDFRFVPPPDVPDLVFNV